MWLARKNPTILRLNTKYCLNFHWVKWWLFALFYGNTQALFFILLSLNILNVIITITFNQTYYDWGQVGLDGKIILWLSDRLLCLGLMGAQLRVSPGTLLYHSAVILEELKKVLDFSPMMLKVARLSDTGTLDGCSFFCLEMVNQILSVFLSASA